MMSTPRIGIPSEELKSPKDAGPLKRQTPVWVVPKYTWYPNDTPMIAMNPIAVKTGARMNRVSVFKQKLYSGIYSLVSNGAFGGSG